jgi:hypothetical protein
MYYYCKPRPPPVPKRPSGQNISQFPGSSNSTVTTRNQRGHHNPTVSGSNHTVSGDRTAYVFVGENQSQAVLDRVLGGEQNGSAHGRSHSTGPGQDDYMTGAVRDRRVNFDLPEDAIELGHLSV